MKLLRLTNLISIFLACTTVAFAQNPNQLRVVASSNDGIPLRGALIAILGDDGRVLAEGVSNASGISALNASPGNYRVRVRRIGFLPFVSAPLSMSPSQVVNVVVDTQPVVLHAILITAKATCSDVGSQPDAIGSVWAEIEKALRMSQLTLADISPLGWSRTYRKRVSGGGAVLQNDSNLVLLRNTKPFGSPDPEVLATRGYVQGGEIQGWEYYGPDEAVLLSESFRQTHCFRLERDSERPGQIGIAFAPIPRRKLADITGTFWVDDSSSTLTEVTFRYTNAGLLSRFRAGGFTRFKRLDSGGLLVSEWEISAPSLEMRSAATQEIVANGYAADGGMIISGAEYDSLNSRAASGATIIGTVRGDAGRPVRGAEIRLSSGRPAAITDSLGRFVIGALPEGTFVIRVRRLGFVAQDYPITLKQSQRRKVILDLPRAIVELTPVEVSATASLNSKFDEFFARRSRGMGTFISHEQIQQRSVSHVAQLIQSIPGLRVRQTGSDWAIQSQRCAPSPFESNAPKAVLLFVDGFFATEGLSRLDNINPAEVEGIEVYQGAAQLPAEARGRGCAAIFVWLRQAPTP